MHSHRDMFRREIQQKREGAMREKLRVLLATCFYYSGLITLAHWWTRRFKRRLIILNYHSAAGDNLRRQMLYLRRHYCIMHLEAALEELYASRQHRQTRDRRLSLVLTFDDGYLDNYTRGLQLARELRVPITLFIIPGYVESGNYFWWLAGKFLVSHAQVDKVMIEGSTHSLTRPDERQALLHTIDTHLRCASSIAEREAFLKDLQCALGVSLPKRSGSVHDDGLLPLTWSELREMERGGWVSFGAHTMHHPVLAHLSDPAEVRREIVECRHVLEQQLGHLVRIFAYPIGKLRHIGDEGLLAVQEAGYKWALTTIEEINTPQTDPLLLRRLPGDLDQHWLVQAAELVGLLGWSRFGKKV